MNRVSAALRRAVHARAGGACEYCLLPEELAFAAHEVAQSSRRSTAGRPRPRISRCRVPFATRACLGRADRGSQRQRLGTATVREPDPSRARERADTRRSFAHWPSPRSREVCLLTRADRVRLLMRAVPSAFVAGARSSVTLKGWLQAAHSSAASPSRARSARVGARSRRGGLARVTRSRGGVLAWRGRRSPPNNRVRGSSGAIFAALEPALAGAALGTPRPEHFEEFAPSSHLHRRRPTRRATVCTGR